MKAVLVPYDEYYTIIKGSSFMGSTWCQRPIFGRLPNEQDNEDAPVYLTGLEIITNKWVNKGFCHAIYSNYGLVIDEAFPMSLHDSRGEQSAYILIRFCHILEHALSK